MSRLSDKAHQYLEETEQQLAAKPSKVAYFFSSSPEQQEIIRAINNFGPEQYIKPNVPYSATLDQIQQALGKSSIYSPPSSQQSQQQQQQLRIQFPSSSSSSSQVPPKRPQQQSGAPPRQPPPPQFRAPALTLLEYLTEAPVDYVKYLQDKGKLLAPVGADDVAIKRVLLELTATLVSNHPMRDLANTDMRREIYLSNVKEYLDVYTDWQDRFYPAGDFDKPLSVSPIQSGNSCYVESVLAAIFAMPSPFWRRRLLREKPPVYYARQITMFKNNNSEELTKMAWSINKELREFYLRWSDLDMMGGEDASSCRIGSQIRSIILRNYDGRREGIRMEINNQYFAEDLYKVLAELFPDIQPGCARTDCNQASHLLFGETRHAPLAEAFVTTTTPLIKKRKEGKHKAQYATLMVLPLKDKAKKEEKYYTLQAVVLRQGDNINGHYTTLVRSATDPDNQWDYLDSSYHLGVASKVIKIADAHEFIVDDYDDLEDMKVFMLFYAMMAEKGR